MTKGRQALASFRDRYVPRAPEYPYPRGRIEGECEQIQGFHLLIEAPTPTTDFNQGYPPLTKNTRGTNTCIWVIDSKGMPYIIEEGLQELEWQRPKHTNLTGDKEAYVGGELWFRSNSSLYVSGGSGRYPPLCENQLEDAVVVFEAFGYVVRSLGWDQETGARRYLEEQ